MKLGGIIYENFLLFFGVYKEEDLKPYKDCGFVLIRDNY